jgi:hypothetical protein
MKSVVICTSRSFFGEAEKWKGILKRKGYGVVCSPVLADQDSPEAYDNAHTLHYKNISKSDTLLVLNLEKNGVKGYIGPSVFAEIAFAIGLNISFGKRIEIYCLNPVPENLPHSEELKLWERLDWIKYWKEK